MTSKSATFLTNLHQLLNQAFDLAGIRTLCLDLNIDYESVAGEEKPSRIRELLLGLGRNGRLPELLTLVAEKRPRTSWPPLPDDFQLPEALLEKTAVQPSQYHIYNVEIKGSTIGSALGEGASVQAEIIAGRDVNKGYSPEELARLIAEWTRLNQTETRAADPDTTLLQTCHKETVIKLSAPRYQLDSRFVQITLLIDQGVDAQGIRFTPDSQRQKYSSLTTLLAEIDTNAIVLLGKPGSGKTTLLRRLQLEHAWAELEAPTGAVSFFIPLNSYRRPDSNGSLPDPYDWLADVWRIHQPNLPDFKTLYEAGKMLLLLDGLNEIPHTDKADYRQRIRRWKTFCQRTAHYGNTLVFSCRSLDYSVPLSGESAVVRQTRLEPLTPSQIEQFLRLHLAEKSASVWQTLRHDPQRLALFSAPFFLRLLVDQIEATGTMPAGQAALLTNFVRRSLYREMERQHPHFLPSPLLSEDDCQQTVANLWPDPFDLPAEGDLIPSLEQLAYQMQAGWEAEEMGLVRAKTTEVNSLLNHPQAKMIVEAGCQLNLLDKELGRREITFFHQLIQEYFAARMLARNPEPDRLRVPWHVDGVTESLADTVAGLETSDPLPQLPATGWEETTLLAAAMSHNQEAFVSDLIAPNLPLAARCAAAAEVAVSARLTQRLREELLARMNSPQADLRARIAAAEALGELGDPRFARRSGSHGDYLLPPTAPIPPDSYPIGDDESDYSREKPAHTVSIDAFEIALFPLTNAEYRLFMEAGGYEEERWWQTEAARAWLRGEGSSEGQKAGWRDTVELLQNWTEEALRNAPNFTPEEIETYVWFKKASSDEIENQLDEWYPAGKKYRQPEFWEDGRFNHPSQPVVGLTWFEARAYCAWLSAQTGDDYRLPTEVEWEAAARGKAGRPYAWGEEYDTAKCNSFETHIRATTPVGVFPDGRTPEGISDLSGNVWEWTSTIWGEKLQAPDFPYPYDPQDDREDETDATSRRLLRGGSWDDGQDLVRAAFRGIYLPFDRDFDVGCRLVVRRSPSQ